MPLEWLILGAVQGVAEWLPISSKSILLLLAAELGIEDAYALALAINGASFAAPLIYFNRVYLQRATLRFLLGSLIGTSLVGLPMYVVGNALTGIGEPQLHVVIGLMLVVMGLALSRAGAEGRPPRMDVREGLLAGAFQGLAALPGISRSGITILYFLLRGYAMVHAVRTSFLMSPVANLGGLALGLTSVGGITWGYVASFAVALLISIVTMNMLSNAAKKYGWFLSIVVGVFSVVAGLWLLIV